MTPSNSLIWEASMPSIQPTSLLSAKKMLKGIILKAGNEATLRLEIENALGAHENSFHEVPFKGFRMLVPYVLIKGTSSAVDVKVSGLGIAHTLLKRDSRNGMLVVDCPHIKSVGKFAVSWFRL